MYEPHPKAFSSIKEHLTISPKSGVGALSSVSTFNHKRAPVYVMFTATQRPQIRYNGAGGGLIVKS